MPNVKKEVLHQLELEVNAKVNKLGVSAQKAVLQMTSSRINSEEMFEALGKYDDVAKDGSKSHDEATLGLRSELLKVAASLVEICIAIDSELLAVAHQK